MSSSQDSEVCRKEDAPSPPPLIQNGKIVLQTHHIGWIIAGCMTIIATAISFWLVNKHLQWYTNKREQRYIVRILFMVPLYATISFASYLWWNHATPIILLRDGYESTVLTAFFYLLLMTKKREPVQRWMFPLGFIKWKPVDGLYFLQLMKWGVLQYCVLRPLTTLCAVILDYLGLYCEQSWGLGWGHIYITIVVSVSVSIAMFCLIQLYMAVSKDLARHRPLLKLFAIKAVVFLTFWQATFLSLLSMFGVVKDTQYMTADDINIGIGAVLETVEMVLFALLHIKAFTYKIYRPPYDPDSDLLPPEKTPRWKSLGHAMDFRETFKELWIGCVYMWHKSLGKEPAVDTGAIRAQYYEGVFGKARPTQYQQRQDEEDSDDGNIDSKQPTLPQVQVEVTERVEVDIGGEKQWLGVGDNYGYGLKFLQRERSEGLEMQIEKELEKRGYTLRNEEAVDLDPPKHPKQKSWWRSIYNRISQSGQDEPRQHEGESTANRPLHHAHSRNRTGRRSRSKRISQDGDVAQGLLSPMGIDIGALDLEDQPPPSLIARKNRRELTRSVDKWRRNIDTQTDRHEDVLMPLPEPKRGRTGGRVRGHTNEPARRHDRLSPLSDTVGSSGGLAVIDPRQDVSLQSPGSEGRLEGMFKSAIHDPPLQVYQAPTDTARSEISSAEGYRLAKPTPSIHLIPTQPHVIPADQPGPSAQRRSTQYHLADEGAHKPMAADVIVSSNRLPEEQGSHRVLSSPTSAAPAPAHRRESASSRHYPDLEASEMPPEIQPSTPIRRSVQQLQTQASPSASPTSLPSRRPPAALRRSSAQYYSFQSQSHPDSIRQSLPSDVDIPYPSSVSPPTPPKGRRRQHRHSREGHRFSQDTLVFANHAPTLQSPSSPRSLQFPSPSVIDDGLSRYPSYVSPTRPTMTRPS
ncbi:hypothetical protein NP233_g4098 [Leucocoprinus birnbaumii]|uniref:DUF300-domain-containing protein n=1 Tax=Leucocoprinus birnbaumii TaxID=56174 RepID=A0AAD5VVA4_9AGAR|nr:hypothetical protein NP233_g4098 [Leucocoprinus birnbaumii]